MSDVETVLKVLKFFPDNWERIKTESKNLETKLSEGKSLLEKYNQTASNFVTDFFEDLTLDGEAIKGAIHNSNSYAKIKGVVLDFPTLCSLPEDLNSIDELSTLIQAKITLLAPLFEGLLKDETKGDEAVTLVNEIVATGMQFPADFDFQEISAFNDLRNQKLTEMKPKMFRLLELFWGKDYTHSNIDRAIEKTNNIVGIIISEPDKEPESLIEFIDGAKAKIPAIKQELADVDFPDINMDQLSNNSIDFLEKVKEIMPEIEDKIGAMDANTLTPASIAENVKDIITSLQKLKECPAVSEVMEILEEIFGFIKLKGVPLEKVLTDLQAILEIPEVSDLKDLIPHLKEKAEKLLDLFSHIEIPGLDSSSLIKSAKKMVTEVFDIDVGVSLDLSMILDKVLGLIKKEITLPGINLDLKDLLQKVQLIAKFLKENNIRFSLKNKVDEGAGSPDREQTMSGGRAGTPGTTGTAGTGGTAGTAGGGTAGTADAAGTAGGTADATPEPSNLLRAIFNLLGEILEDRLDDELPTEFKKWADRLRNDTILEDVETALGYEKFVSDLKGQRDNFLKIFEGSGQPPLEVVLDKLLEAVFISIHILILKLKELLLAMIEVPFKLLELLIEIIRCIKLPNWLADFIGDLNPVCLIIALPYTIIKGLLDLCSDDIKSWVDEAA